jgi:hypothetical protein
MAGSFSAIAFFVPEFVEIMGKKDAGTSFTEFK